MPRINQRAQDDTVGPIRQSPLPTVKMPAPDPSHDQTGSMGSVPVNQHSLAKYYQNGEYSDLEIETNGSTRRVHKIIVCSESPVIKHKCETLVSPQR